MTKIEWATHTANWLAGCTKVSPACSHCYAETMSARLATMPHAPQRYRDGVVEGRRWTGEVSYDAAALRAVFEELRRAKHPRRVFINSMSDTFHERVPPASLQDLAQAIRGMDQEFLVTDLPGAAGSLGEPRRRHVIMLLTKRPDRMLAWQRERFPGGLPAWVWVGCTVEDQRRAEGRIPHLLQVRAAGVRFLSVEPMLGRVDLRNLALNGMCDECGEAELHDALDACCRCGCTVEGSEPVDWRQLGWVIAGCESGAGRRETSVEWVRAIRDDCAEAGVPFFLKQLYVDGKKVGLPELDGRTWAEVPGDS